MSCTDINHLRAESVPAMDVEDFAILFPGRYFMTVRWTAIDQGKGNMPNSPMNDSAESRIKRAKSSSI
jgi:hypothetical protein